MGGGCTGAPTEGGQEGDEGLLGIGFADTRGVLKAGGSKVEEPDAASRRLPPQPEGLMAKGPHSVSVALNGVPAPPCAHLRAWRPFAINAAPIDYLDGLLDWTGPAGPFLRIPHERPTLLR